MINNKKNLDDKKRLIKKILVITDNLFIYENFKKIAAKQPKSIFVYRFSPNNKIFLERFASNKDFISINVESEYSKIIKDFDLVISAHSKQLFPKEMVNNIRCINIHPGYNPYNRGWYPHVFSIINGLPTGVTIHEIDSRIDHGPIIDQRKIPLYQWDTSTTSYNRILQTEVSLIKKNINKIIFDKYSTKRLKKEGNLNMKKDFDKLCQLDLDKVQSFRVFLNLLRALTHDGCNNAYFIEEKSKKKIYVTINLKRDEKGI